MRVLHVITSLYNGGAERLMVDLLPRLRDVGGLDVDLLLFNGVDTNFKKELSQQGINIISCATTNDVYHPRSVSILRHLLTSYDVVHTHNTACQYYVALASVLTRHHAVLVTTEHNATNRRRGKFWLKPVDRWMYNKYASIVCIADQTHDNLKQYLGSSEKLQIIHNGVDISRFIRPIKDVAAKQDFVLTMVAAYRQQKDHETLMRAMKRLPDNYRLQFVGGGDPKEGRRIKDCCSELGLNDRVSFMGVRQDIPDILDKSDVVVLSSHWEGLSLSSIEGMASGRPFVASDVDGLREIVTDAGVLFEHGNDKDLAEKIQRLCENPDEYRKVAQRCQEKARQYDISVMANNYLGLYQQVLR